MKTQRQENLWTHPRLILLWLMEFCEQKYKENEAAHWPYGGIDLLTWQGNEQKEFAGIGLDGRDIWPLIAG